MLLSVPGDVAVLRPIFRVTRQENPFPLEIGKPLPWYTFFDELLPVEDYPVIVVYRPEAAIKLPVRILAES